MIRQPRHAVKRRPVANKAQACRRNAVHLSYTGGMPAILLRALVLIRRNPSAGLLLVQLAGLLLYPLMQGIDAGRLLFNGGAITDPAIELRAVRRDTEDVTVGIYARGTLAAPQFSLFSTPDMPQDQQLSWLVLGRPMEQNATAGERSAVNDAALSLGVSGGSYLTQRLGSGLKLDEISIASKPGQTADQAQFTIGKYLSPKLFISYGIGVFQPGHSFRLLYDIGKHFKLSTESGVESGGDLIYTIEK